MFGKSSGLRITAEMLMLVLFGLATYVSMVSFSISLRQGDCSGVVYAETGVPVQGAMVIASGNDGYGTTTTNPMGQYSIAEGLKTGTYDVSFIAEGYLQEEVKGISVATGHETTGVNAYLHRSGGISGNTTDAVSGLPLQGVLVMASSSGGDTYGWSGITDTNGNYKIVTNLATGTYNVTVIFPEGYVMKSVGGIAVTTGLEVKGVNLALERSGTILGRVTSASGGVPLGNVTVYASSDAGYFGYNQTEATGHYRISSGLGTGMYTVLAMSGMSFDQVEDVNVVAGAETSDINLQLDVSPPPPSGLIMGRVTAMDSSPIEGALVAADGSAGSGEDYTDQNGNYVISSGLGTGTYVVTASATGYTTKSTSGVSVIVDQVTSNVDFQLSKIPPAQSGRISGTVSGEANPIPEFRYSIVALLASGMIVVALAKLLNRKARDYHISQGRIAN